MTLHLADLTSNFIKEQGQQPFLAYLSFYAVHSPLQTTQELWKKYRDKAAQNPHTGSRFIVDGTKAVRQVQDHPIYAGMMETLDQAVGSVLDTLEETGLDKNTIIVFTSDNGGVTMGDAFSTSVLPLRGGKGRLWEGGIRVPYYIKASGYPAGISETLATGTDFFPTLLDLAGLDLLPEQHQDGISLVPALKGQSIPDRTLFWHFPHYSNQGGYPGSIVRHKNFKLIQYHEDMRLVPFPVSEFRRFHVL